MNILALDLGTKCGWAYSGGISGVQDFTPRRGDSPGMKWLEFRAWLRRFLAAAPTQVVAYEMAHHRGGAATHSAHALIGQLEAVVAEQCAAGTMLEITSRHSATIKKHALGSGRGDKDGMFAAARAKWSDRTLADHNEADALWLLDLVMRDYGVFVSKQLQQLT